jgi:DNA-directed RNA polymerase specialized sigma24 family protein
VTDEVGFEMFVVAIEPRLRRAFVGLRGVDGAGDATAEALAWAWEHWIEVQAMTNPAGYLYRVGQSRTRRRRHPDLPSVESMALPEVEPLLVPALLELPEQQRTAVWLVHGCHWRQTEVAEAMGISASAVSTHVSRALTHLRRRLEVEARA